jgi:hypothetical protein
MEDSFTPFIVYGPSKSGTTWLQKTLDSHPEVRCHFQLPLFPFNDENDVVSVHSNVVYSRLKSPFKGVFKSKEEERKYWVRLRYFQQLRPLLEEGMDRLKKKFPDSEDQAYMEELLHETYRAITPRFLMDEPGKKVYGLKSTTDFEFFFKVYPKAKVITIIRDGRDVATSKRFHAQKRGAYFLGDEKNKLLYWLDRFKPTRLAIELFRRQFGWFGEQNFRSYTNDDMQFTEAALTKFSHDWYLTTSFILKYQQQYPDQFLLVRYEQMKQNQAGTLKEIFDFLGVKDDQAVVEEVMAATDFKKLKKNQKDSFFRKGAMGDWKNYFSEKDKAIFKKYTKDLLVRLEYENDQNW